MKRVLKWVGIVVGVVVLLAGGGIAYLFVAFPKVPPPSDVKVASTPELVERGKYLASHVSACVDCHGQRDWTRFSGPLKPGTRGAGGGAFTTEMGLPGNFYARNITPAGIGEWTDGELIRAFTMGVDRAGGALFPLMPYPYYAKLCDRDVDALVAYLRSLEAIPSEPLPERSLNFPLPLIVRTIPKPAKAGPCPKPGTADYAEYVATIAGCKECHTQQDKGEPLPGMDFAGGWEFALPEGRGFVTSSNISPDDETGIGKWTREQFVAKFKSYAQAGAATPVKPGEFNTTMPWTMYGGMSEEDLGAIFDYLKKQKPVKNKVERFRASR